MSPYCGQKMQHPREASNAYCIWGELPGLVVILPPSDGEVRASHLTIRVSQPLYDWHFGPGSSLGSCPEHYGIFSSIPGLFPLDAKSTPCPAITMTTKSMSRYCWMSPTLRTTDVNERLTHCITWPRGVSTRALGGYYWMALKVPSILWHLEATEQLLS